MKKSLFAGATLTARFSGHARANEPLTLVLDWYINPDHARRQRGIGRGDNPAVPPLGL